MNQLKRACALLLSLGLTLSLAACGSTPANDDNTPVEPPVSSTPEETPAMIDRVPVGAMVVTVALRKGLPFL